MLRDSVWIDSSLCFVSAEYTWHKLYLAERSASTIYKLCLDSTRLFGVDADDTRTYKESGTKYKATASAPFRALEEIGEQHRNRIVAIVGPNSTLLRPGMGVVIDPPLHRRVQAANVETVYGSVTAIDAVSCSITFRLHLGNDNLPEYVIGNLGPNELVQTNVALKVPFDWVSGSFRLWPPQLFQADCIPQAEPNLASKFLGRIVVCDMEIHLDDENFSEDDCKDAKMVTFEIFEKLLKGSIPLTLSRLKPFPAQAALAYLFHIHELEGGLNPPATAYRPLLGHAVTTFARLKAGHLKSANQLSFRPDMPGRALMELLYRLVKPEDRNVVIRNGNMMVEVSNLDALIPVFNGLNPSRHDFRGEGLGVIEIDGPMVFKWSMYDTLDPTGPLGGSTSICVGSYTEWSRMGTDVIKSSRCHPDALRGGFIKAPAEKKARTSKASPGTETTKKASKAPAQAMERMQRQVRRMRVSAGAAGSTSESTAEESDARRSTSQPPHCSDSQSGGDRDGPADPGAET